MEIFYLSITVLSGHLHSSILPEFFLNEEDSYWPYHPPVE